VGQVAPWGSSLERAEAAEEAEVIEIIDDDEDDVVVSD
jgi:hypothetical protein